MATSNVSTETPTEKYEREQKALMDRCRNIENRFFEDMFINGWKYFMGFLILGLLISQLIMARRLAEQNRTIWHLLNQHGIYKVEK